MRQLLKYQLDLFGKIARAPDSDVLRQLTFRAGTLEPAADQYVRRVGRPRLEWASMLKQMALECAGSTAALQKMIRQAPLWKSIVAQYCSGA